MCHTESNSHTRCARGAMPTWGRWRSREGTVLRWWREAPEKAYCKMFYHCSAHCLQKMQPLPGGCLYSTAIPKILPYSPPHLSFLLSCLFSITPAVPLSQIPANSPLLLPLLSLLTASYRPWVSSGLLIFRQKCREARWCAGRSDDLSRDLQQ